MVYNKKKPKLIPFYTEYLTYDLANTIYILYGEGKSSSNS